MPDTNLAEIELLCGLWLGPDYLHQGQILTADLAEMIYGGRAYTTAFVQLAGRKRRALPPVSWRINPPPMAHPRRAETAAQKEFDF